MFPNIETMNCLAEIVDTSTGEIVLTSKFVYAFNNESTDAGFKTLRRFLNSVIEKTRKTGIPHQIRFFFHDETIGLTLPFQTTLNFDNPYEIKEF